MDILEYYRAVFPQLENAFSESDYFISNEKALIEELGADPNFPVVTFDKKDLWYVTVERGFQVHLPVIGHNTVLAPMDYELFLCKDQKYLFRDLESHKYFFQSIWPVINYIKDLFIERGMPFMLDYTASGGHILFYNPLWQNSSKELMKISYLEEGVIRNCTIVHHDALRRREPIAIECAAVFSGLVRLAEYIALLTMKSFKGNVIHGKLPVMISDAAENCINLDNSWGEGSPALRCIRSPFSLHKKNYEKYGLAKIPLCDVVGLVFDGHEAVGYNDMDHILECMWDLDKATQYAQTFTGHIPNANDTLIDFINEYRTTELYQFHQDFDHTPDIEPGKAIIYAREMEDQLSDIIRWMLYWPNPMCLQPINLIKFIREFIIVHKWKPKHVANILRDLYSNPEYGWLEDYQNNYPADEKANFWTRTYAALAYIEEGYLNI